LIDLAVPPEMRITWTTGRRLYYQIVKAVPRFGTNRGPGELWLLTWSPGAPLAWQRDFSRWITTFPAIDRKS
jgi:hypothetical protein